MKEERDSAADDAPPTSENEAAPTSTGGTTTPPSAAIGFGVPLAITAAVAGTLAFAFSPERAGTNESFLSLGALYAVLSAVAVLRLRSQGELFRLRPRTGDLTFAAMVTLVLYGLAFAFHSLVTSRGEAHHGWIVRVYLVAGNPFSEQRHLVAGGIALLAALEELTWRGYVTPLLEERLGPLKGGALATALFALAHLPTVWLLADPVAGLNPLLPFAAFGCGAAWTYLRWRMDRLVPSLISHALFTWAMVEFPLWGMGSG